MKIFERKNDDDNIEEKNLNSCVIIFTIFILAIFFGKNYAKIYRILVFIFKHLFFFLENFVHTSPRESTLILFLFCLKNVPCVIGLYLDNNRHF